MAACCCWAITAMLIGLVFTRAMQRAFLRFRSRERKVGKELVYRHFPRHKKPLGGGVAILGTLLVAGALARLLYLQQPGIAWQPVWLCLLAGALFAGIGFIDDWRKVQAARGIREWLKLLLQVVGALIVTYLLVLVRQPGDHLPATALYIPSSPGWNCTGFFFPSAFSSSSPWPTR